MIAKHVALLILLLVVGALPAAAEQDARLPKEGTQMASFALPDVDGKLVDTSTYSGKPLVINFWAFWCDTWKAELPYLKTLSDDQENLGFNLVTVSVDGTRISEFDRITGGQTPFPVLLDIGGKVSAQYNAWHVPTVIILDGDGRVVYTHTGYPGNGPILNRLRYLASHKSTASPER